MPYACLSLAALLDANWDAPGLRRVSARGYLFVTAGLFLFFLPVLMALPIPAKLFFFEILPGLRPWTWFPTWV